MNELVVIEHVVSRADEIAALREALAQANRRAALAEAQLNDVVMGASIKLAAARMVLQSAQKKLTGPEQAAVMAVLDCIPENVVKAQRALLKRR
jgi:hypothetical protein